MRAAGKHTPTHSSICAGGMFAHLLLMQMGHVYMSSPTACTRADTCTLCYFEQLSFLNSSQPGSSPWPGGWGPLIQNTLIKLPSKIEHSFKKANINKIGAVINETLLPFVIFKDLQIGDAF